MRFTPLFLSNYMFTSTFGCLEEGPLIIMHQPMHVGRNHRKAIIIALVASLSLFFSVLSGCVLLFKRLRQGHTKNRQRLAHTFKSSKTEEALKLWRIEESGSDFTLYDFTELAAATDNFSIPNRLGRGGFGPVYKASSGVVDLKDVSMPRLLQGVGI